MLVPVKLLSPLSRCLELICRACKPFSALVAKRKNQNLLSSYSHLVVVHFEIPLGAAVIATATLRSLKEAYPSLQVTAIASGHSLDLLEACPYISDVLSAPNPIKKPLSSLLYALTKIWPHRKKFDAIVLDGGNGRTLITLFAVLTGIKRRVGYSVNPWLLHVPACDKQASSNIEKNNRAFNAISSSPLKVMEPVIFFAAHDVIKFNGLFQDFSEERPRIVLVTETSLGHPNAWFSDRFVSLSKQLITKYNAFIVLVGANSNRANIEVLRDTIGYDSVSLAGSTSPRELAALMANCDFCISVDTGAMHVARSVILPTVILGHSADPKTLWLPPVGLSYIELIRKDHLPCSLCRKFECFTKECMDEISVHEVHSAFCRLRDTILWGPLARAKRISSFTSPRVPNRFI
jgi:heptosyltransferase-2